MKILIVYTTRTGSAARAARLLEGFLPGTRTADLAEESPDPSGYDAVILGSGIRFDRIGKPLRAYLERYWTVLGEMDKAIYICNAFPEEERGLFRSNFSVDFRNACILATSFGSSFDPEKLSMRERLLVRASKPQLFESVEQGLMPVLDEKKIRVFARDFLDAIDPPRMVFDPKRRRLVPVRTEEN